jgi:succinate dehydrogenase / fumarate reductase iron-sulfur subunit
LYQNKTGAHHKVSTGREKILACKKKYFFDRDRGSRMERIFKIYRYDPKADKAPRYQEYRLIVEPIEKILDCLNRIRWEQDPTLSFRMSCAHGICGSDGMRINGFCTLACQRLVKDFPEDPILIEPLPNFRVVKDLVVDLEPFFAKYRAMRPYLIAEAPLKDGERIQSQKERKAFDEAIRCILCACCTAACPITEQNDSYSGPAALLRAFRYLFDSRDQASPERMQLLDTDDGIWGCKGHGKCTEVCPKEIDVRKALGRTKKKIYDTKQK